MTTVWTAAFITPASTTGVTDEPASYLRREFHVSKQPVRATLHVTALGLVDPHLNGAVVGDEVLAPGWTSYRHRLVVSTHTVTDQIRVGTNAVGAVLGEGWALGRLGWEDRRNHYAERPALWLQLELEYADGTVEVIRTDTEFRSSTGGVRENSIYDGEVFDARLEPDGWDLPGFDDSRWETTEELDWPLESLVSPIAEPIRRIEELEPVAILMTPKGRTVADFGQNISGWVHLKVEGPTGSTITLRHA